MSKRILVAKDTKLGNLNDYIELISTLKEEFGLDLREISEIHSDKRDVFVKFNLRHSVIELDYSYEYNELYFNIIVKGDEKDEENVIKLILRTKELVTEEKVVKVTEGQREAINKILNSVK